MIGAAEDSKSVAAQAVPTIANFRIANLPSIGKTPAFAPRQFYAFSFQPESEGRTDVFCSSQA
jgi:hypothetical protein